MLAGFFSLVLTALNNVKPEHLVIDFLFQLFKVDDQLVAILIKSRSVFSLYEAMDLQFLIDNVLDLLHRFKD